MGRQKKPKGIIEERGMNDFFYYYYKKHVGSVSMEEKCKLRTKYRAVINGYFKFLFMKLLEGFDINLSRQSSLGTLSIRGKKLDFSNVDTLPVDWPNTLKLWNSNPEAKINKTYVRLTNEHSGMVRYRVAWVKAFSKLTNKYYYSFDPVRKLKRSLSKVIKDGKEYYVLNV